MIDQPVSIVVPTASLGEKSLAMLEVCLKSIQMQDYPHINVVVTDHSIDDEIQDYIYKSELYDGCPTWDLILDIQYLRFNEKRGFGVANTNHGIDHVPDDHFVMIMCQDNYYYSSQAISKMVTIMEHSGAHWCAAGCNHVDDNYNSLNFNHPPKWVSTFEMAMGLNLIGGPSVVMVRQCPMRQDEELTYLNDCEFYYRLGQEYGPPALLPDMLVTISMRDTSVSAGMDIPTVKAREQEYVQNKHG